MKRHKFSRRSAASVFLMLSMWILSMTFYSTEWVNEFDADRFLEVSISETNYLAIALNKIVELLSYSLQS